MKKFLFLFALLVAFFAFNLEVQAARVVSNPYVAPAVIPDYFTVVLNGGSPTQSPIAAVPGGQGFSFTIDGLASGDHGIKVTACKDFGTPFGVRCSSEAVFTFAVPGAPTATQGLRLAP